MPHSPSFDYPALIFLSSTLINFRASFGRLRNLCEHPLRDFINNGPEEALQACFQHLLFRYLLPWKRRCGLHRTSPLSLKILLSSSSIDLSPFPSPSRSVALYLSTRRLLHLAFVELYSLKTCLNRSPTITTSPTTYYHNYRVAVASHPLRTPWKLRVRLQIKLSSSCAATTNHWKSLAHCMLCAQDIITSKKRWKWPDGMVLLQ